MTELPHSNPEKWVDDHGDYLLGYACSRIKDRSAAEDILQETFLAALRSRNSFDGKKNVRYWLLGILKHKLVDHIRKVTREVSVEDTETLETRGSLFFDTYGIPLARPAPWRMNPRKAFEQREFWEVFSNCVAGLKGITHQAYTLRELEDLSTEDLCEVLGIEPNYLWVILHRARDQLKACLEKNWIKRNQASS